MLNTTENRKEYAGDGVTTAFAFPYKFLVDADIVVIERDNTTQVETTKTLTTHYTLSGAGSESGGTITMLTSPAAGKTLVIFRNPALIQGTDLVENEALPADEVEKNFGDKVAMWAQRLSERINRCIGLSDGANASFNGTLPNPLTALGILRVKGDLSGFDFGTIEAFTFEQSSPMTTKGDLIVRDTSAAARLAVGADGAMLFADSTQAKGMAWAVVTTTKGDLMGRGASAPVRVPVGSDRQFLMADSSQASGLTYDLPVSSKIFMFQNFG
jgi:hypothetical protein